MAVLSLGPEHRGRRRADRHRRPVRAARGLPVVDGALPMRYALALIPLIAIVLALAADRRGAPARRDRRGRLAGAGGGRRSPRCCRCCPRRCRPPSTARRCRSSSPPGTGASACPGGVLVPVPLPTPKEPGADALGGRRRTPRSRCRRASSSARTAGRPASMGTTRGRPRAARPRWPQTGARAGRRRRRARAQAEPTSTYWGADPASRWPPTRRTPASLRATLEAAARPRPPGSPTPGSGGSADARDRLAQHRAPRLRAAPVAQRPPAAQRACRTRSRVRRSTSANSSRGSCSWPSDDHLARGTAPASSRPPPGPCG